MISQAIFLFISGAEIGFILFVILLVFGADKVPEIARGLGKTIRQVKDATNDIKSEITKSAEREGIDIDITKDVRKEIDKVKEFSILKGTVLMVRDGDTVKRGDQLTEGSLDLREYYCTPCLN